MAESKPVKFLTRDQILAADDRPKHPVHVPQWGGSVLVSPLSGEERDAFEAEWNRLRAEGNEAHLRNVRARLVARAVVGEDGARLIQDEDIEAFGRKNGAALDLLFDEVRRVSGMLPGAVEAAEKN